MQTSFSPFAYDLPHELRLVDDARFGNGVEYLIRERRDARPDVSQFCHVVAQLRLAKEKARHPCEATGEDSATTWEVWVAGDALFV